MAQPSSLPPSTLTADTSDHTNIVTGIYPSEAKIKHTSQPTGITLWIGRARSPRLSPLGQTDVATSTIATICFQETAESWSLGQELQALQHFLVITGNELCPQELQTHVYVEQTLESMVPLSLRDVDENL